MVAVDKVREGRRDFLLGFDSRVLLRNRECGGVGSGDGATADEGKLRVIQPVPERAGNAVFYNVLFDVDNRDRALFSDMTVQVGRIASTSLAGAARPLRLCYAGEVAVIDAEKFQLIDSIPAGKQPVRVALQPDEQKKKRRTIIACWTEGSRDRMVQVLKDHGLEHPRLAQKPRRRQGVQRRAGGSGHHLSLGDKKEGSKKMGGASLL